MFFLQESNISNNAEAERLTMHRCIITSIIESETVYVECLYVMEKVSPLYAHGIKAYKFIVEAKGFETWEKSQGAIRVFCEISKAFGCVHS